MKLISIILFLLFSTSALAKGFCTFKTYSKLVFVNSENVTVDDIVKLSNCSNEVNKKISQYLRDSNGMVWSQYIANEITNTRVVIEPQKIQTRTLNTILKQEFLLEDQFNFKDIKLFGNQKVFKLEEDQNIKITCQNCKTTGSKKILIQVNDTINNSNKKIWATAQLVQSIPVFISNDTLAAGNSLLNGEQFQKRIIKTTSPERYVSKLERLRFYKLTRPLKSGAELTRSHLTPIQLVRQGRPVKIVLNNSNISLSAKALPMRSGKIGEIIQLKNIRSKKIIIGKVVDFNKVVVEL